MAYSEFHSCYGNKSVASSHIILEEHDIDLWRHLTYNFKGAWHTLYAMLR